MFTAGKNSWSCAQFSLLNKYSYSAGYCRADVIAEGPSLTAFISLALGWGTILLA